MFNTARGLSSLALVALIGTGLVTELPSAAPAPTAPLVSPTAVAAGAVQEVQVAGTAGVPGDATAATIQVTVANTAGVGYITAFPCAAPRPTASMVNFGPRETRSNLTLVQLGAGGKVCLYTSAPADLIVDVFGFVGAGSPWQAVTPERVVDTRGGVPGRIGVAGGSTVRVPVTAPESVGDDATAAALNITALDSRTHGYLTVHPCDDALPEASNVNFEVGMITPNLSIVPVTNGETCIYASHDVNVVVDVMGWTSDAGAVTGVTPTRLTDTRHGLGGGRLDAGQTRRVRVDRAGAGAAAVVNVTATRAPREGYLTVHPCDGPRTETSNTNVMPPRTASSLAVAAPDASGDVCVYASMSTDLVVDLNAWLEPSAGYQALTPQRLLDTRQVASTGSGGGSGPVDPGNTGSVASNFDRSGWLATGERIPEDSSWEPSGSFRTFCGFSHLGYDDPIVFPGQNNAAHLHTFFGNTATDENSTYQSLRSGGSSTCQGGPLNRTGYWVPAMHDASGAVVVPEVFEIYYKGNGSQADIQSIQTNPNGLRMIAGFDMNDPGALRAEWSCNGGGGSTTIPNCGSGQTLRVELRFPMCWNGRDLDSANHRSHMAYGTGGDGWFTKEGGCPSSHPIHLPELTLFANYVSDGNTANWYLSSDRMPGMTHANGETFHADWFGAWDNEIQETWTQECIREMRSCVWGELGDGTRLINEPSQYTGPDRLPTPPR